MKAKKKTVSKAKKQKKPFNTIRQPGAKYKATKAEILKRVTDIANMLLQSREQDIVPYCSSLKLTDRQARKYKNSAHKKIQKIKEKDIDKNINIALLQLDELYQISENNKERLDVIKERAKLLGLYPDKGTGESQVTIKLIDVETI